MTVAASGWCSDPSTRALPVPSKLPCRVILVAPTLMTPAFRNWHSTRRAVLGTGKNLSETAAAQDANITIDGLTITRPSNTIKGVLEGVTLNLEGVSEAGVSRSQ